jgi:N-methylhydantoinase A
VTEIGFDVGGTFVDVVVHRPSGAWTSKKVLIGESVEASVLRAAEEALTLIDAAPSDVSFIAHGTTLATNTVIEEKGAKVGLITTEGFRDVLEIGRQNRPSIYDSQVPRPTPLVPRRWRREVVERIGPDGEVRRPLEPAGVRAAAADFASEAVEAIAVCLLHAWRNPGHEREVAEILREELPDVAIMLSSDVVPLYREYERTNTLVISAYVLPVLQRYLLRLEHSLKDRGIDVPLWIMQSNGGHASVQEILRRPIAAQFSGPAAGVLGAVAIAQEAGEQNLVALDIGGTSTDVTVAVDGNPEIQRERQVRGEPVLDSSIAVHSVGAGGGSIAWVDPGGLLKVGPGSAGARPGPACYGRGGTEPTVTDAHLLLGYLSEERLLASELRISEELAISAIAPLAARLDMEPEDAAAGIVEVAAVNIVRAVRRVTVENGHDPRDFSLVAFGGGGPLYANLLIRELEMARAIVPVAAGVLSAVGLLSAGPKLELSKSHVQRMNAAAWPTVLDQFTTLEEQALSRMAEQGFSADEVALRWQLDLRYVGQSHELRVAVSEVAPPDEHRLDEAIANYHREHERLYGVAAPSEPVESVATRVVAAHERTLPTLELPAPTAAHEERRRRWRAPDGWAEAVVMERGNIKPGAVIKGPALIDSDDSTIAVLPGYEAKVHLSGLVEITR